MWCGGEDFVLEQFGAGGGARQPSTRSRDLSSTTVSLYVGSPTSTRRGEVRQSTWGEFVIAVEGSDAESQTGSRRC